MAYISSKIFRNYSVTIQIIYCVCMYWLEQISL